MCGTREWKALGNVGKGEEGMEEAEQASVGMSNGG